MDSVQQSFRNLGLSFRGSERQAPGLFNMALRFSKVMEREATASKTMEVRLKEVVAAFNSSGSVAPKHQVNKEAEKVILNIIVGTTEETRKVISDHLAHFKWKDSCFSSSQLQSTRWLLGATAKNMPENYGQALTMTPEAQMMLMQLHVHLYMQAVRKCKGATARAKCRLDKENFEKLCDFATMFASVRAAAKLASSDKTIDQQIMDSFLAKDYYQEIEASIQCKNVSFRLQNLSLWQDIVDKANSGTDAILAATNCSDVVAAEEAAVASKFSAVKAQLAHDCQALAEYHAAKGKTDARKHVIQVLHTKTQEEKGMQQLCCHGREEVMLSRCYTALTSDLGFPNRLDVMMRAVAAKHKVEAAKLIGIVDATKFGINTQPVVNAIGKWAEKLCAKDPHSAGCNLLGFIALFTLGGSCVVIILPLLASASSSGSLREDHRKLEDKLIKHGLELRPFTLLLDNTQQHANRDLPSAYPGLLAVSDSALPSKGTGHRSNKTLAMQAANSKADKASINCFCFSRLWAQQITKPAVPIQESSFVVPGALPTFESKRNMTDAQETAQWLGGTEVPQQILEALLGERTDAVILHGTFYDACVEKACLDMGLTSVSHTADSKVFNAGNKLIKQELLAQWKENRGAMQDVLPRFQENPNAAQIPQPPAVPVFKLCVYADGALALPRDVRGTYLSDPVRAPEWRQLLQEFDRSYANGTSPQTGPTETGSETVDAAFDWSKVFPNETADPQSLKATDGAITFAMSSQVNFIVVEQKLYLEAVEDATLDAKSPLLTYGAGSWLTGERGKNQVKEFPDKSCRCEFGDDTAKVVLEEESGDSNVMTLRQALQRIEAGGMVSYTLGAHRVERPPEVVQGNASDRRG
ncbi:unnamed protein product [Symbiodinium sp. CCMP2456]|nr:unnamed protein product [Symbiodinium sp. CCMP2456]